MVQQVKTPVTNPKISHLSLIPKTHMMEGENRLLKVLVCALTYTHKIDK